MTFLLEKRDVELVALYHTRDKNTLLTHVGGILVCGWNEDELMRGVMAE